MQLPITLLNPLLEQKNLLLYCTTIFYGRLNLECEQRNPQESTTSLLKIKFKSKYMNQHFS
jgi:hypothetical protein